MLINTFIVLYRPKGLALSDILDRVFHENGEQLKAVIYSRWKAPSKLFNWQCHTQTYFGTFESVWTPKHWAQISSKSLKRDLRQGWCIFCANLDTLNSEDLTEPAIIMAALPFHSSAQYIYSPYMQISSIYSTMYTVHISKKNH